MQLRHPRLLAAAASAVVITGAGAALARGQESATQNVQTQQSQAVALGKDEFLDDVADRLGIERSKLDAALEDIALDEVEWALDAGFITEERADALRERIEASASGSGRLGFGHLKFGRLGFGGFGIGANGFLAAAQYLDLTVTQLRNALEDKTLTEIADDQGKSVDALKDALRDAVKEELDDARADDVITQTQEDALLDRLDANLDDIVNGRSPSVTELAERLDVERSKVEDAFEAAAIGQVDQAREQGLITQAQADALKERIESGPVGGFGFGHGFRGGFGHGLGGLGFGHRGGPGSIFGVGGPGAWTVPARFA